MVGMDAFLYMTERLSCGLVELEDALDCELGDRGEVTGSGSGSGSGQTGSNIDVLIRDDTLSEEQALRLIRRVLADHGLLDTTRVVIDGKEYPLA